MDASTGVPPEEWPVRTDMGVCGLPFMAWFLLIY